MFYTYIIQSAKDNSLYKGHCQNLDVRLNQHNSGLTQFIKNKILFKLIYSETFATREEAIKREKYFKSATGKKFLKEKLVM